MTYDSPFFVHKQGDHFGKRMHPPLDVGSWGLDFTDFTVESAITNETGRFYEALRCTWVDRQKPEFLVESEGTTEGWPPTDLRWDIQFTTPDGQVFSTFTYMIKVEKDVTR